MREHSGSLYDCCDTVCIPCATFVGLSGRRDRVFFAMICKMYIESIETTET